MEKYLQLHITLKSIDPPIWRRLLLPAHITFYALHRVIQTAFDWEDQHMHEFHIGKTHILMADSDSDYLEDEGIEVLYEDEAWLDSVLGLKRKFLYWYDFGDDWWHEIAVEKRLNLDLPAAKVELLEGARACPPEDSGGPWGYAGMLQALADKKHPDHQDIKEWHGKFNPERFDLKKAAKRVATCNDLL